MRVELRVEKYRAVLTRRNEKGEVVDEEVWVFPNKLPRDERQNIAKETFDDTYDYLNFLVHGLPASE